MCNNKNTFVCPREERKHSFYGYSCNNHCCLNTHSISILLFSICTFVNCTLYIGSPLAPEKPFAQLVQSTSITVGWFESPCDGGHNLSSFSVHVSEELGNLNNIISTYTNVNPSARRFVVDGLRPDTSYSIRIVAVSSDSRVSLPSPELTITTLPPGRHLIKIVTRAIIVYCNFFFIIGRYNLIKSLYHEWKVNLTV